MEELILKQYDSEVKSVEGERALNVTITTNDVDRSGDIVEPKGAKLTNYKKNPVVLMAHDYHGLPIGKASNLEKTDNGITAKVTFPEEGTYPLADTVYNLYKQKYMKGWSIGFIPIKSEDIVDDEDDNKKMSRGRRFKTWELLEFSACSVPNNPNTLTNMVSKGINVDPLKEAGFITIVEEKKEEEVKDMIKDKLKDVKPEPIDEEKVKASIEKDEKEENDKDEKDLEMNDLINRICEINIENKDLKEKIKDIELKAGAVLNARIKSNLKNAQALIQSVLDEAGEEEGQEGEEEKDTKKDDIVINLTEDKKDDPGKDEAKEEKTITVDEKVISEAVTKALNYTLGITSK